MHLQKCNQKLIAYNEFFHYIYDIFARLFHYVFVSMSTIKAADVRTCIQMQTRIFS